jgi:hypothetical protein
MIKEELDANTQQIEGAVDLNSVDPAYKEILKQSIRDSVTNLPDLGFHKFVRAAERKAIRKIFAKGIELAREDKLPQLIPCTPRLLLCHSCFQAYSFSEILFYCQNSKKPLKKS